MKKRSFRGTAVFSAMVLLAGAAWYSVFCDSGKQDALFMEYRAAASEHEEKEAYITAAEYCVKALEIRKDDTELMTRAAEDYLKCGDRNAFLKYCRMAAEKSPESDRPWILLAEYWINSGDYRKARDVLAHADGSEMPGEVSELKKAIMGGYETGYRAYSEVRGFCSGYCAVSDETGRWGLADENGSLVFLMKYDDIGAYCQDEDIIPVCSDGKWYFSDSEGRIKYVPDRNYTWLGSYSDGLSPFEYDGKYGYMELDYTEKTEKYDYAGPFRDGVAAVRRAGKWSLIDDELREITGFVLDDVTLDGYGFCVNNGKITVVRDGEVKYLDTSGKEISDSLRPACGLVPFCSDGMWGFYGENGDVIISPEFENVLNLSENGRTCVMQDGKWRIMTLLLYR